MRIIEAIPTKRKEDTTPANRVRRKAITTITTLDYSTSLISASTSPAIL
ncbi:MAG: hypothetical protein BWY82_01469 [Verrucomicrobia bacterium ADurb.Bin474]|nr:MAG: hypothetical protein BWY82_01469 [Verrucomicrobia bacterium ADurb.Bin474]